MNQHQADRGLDLFRAGRITEALPLLAHAYDQDPSNQRVLHAYASALQKSGRQMPAIELYRRAAEDNPDQVRILGGWAHTLVKAGLRDQAMPILKRALALDPEDAVVGGLLGMLLREESQPDAAVAVLQPLIARHPAHAGLRWEYARSLWASDHLTESERQFETHRSLCPNDSRNRVALGRLAISRGDIQRARSFFREALDISPADAAAWWELAHADPDAIDSIALARITAMAVATPLPEQRELFEDILARNADQNRKFHEAALHAETANRLRTKSGNRSGAMYMPEDHALEIDSLLWRYSPAFFAQHAGAGIETPKPVFVIGLPRSGTTLIERMLASHPLVAGIGEQRLARESLLLAQAGGQPNMGSIPCDAITCSAAWHLREIERRASLLSARVAPERIVDKLPDNYLLAGWIALTFPRATVIHCLRDPRDVALSCWLGRFAEIPWSSHIEHIVARIEQHRRLMQHWRNVLPRPVHEISYENLVAHPDQVMRGILQTMDLPWNDSVLDFANAAGSVKSASQLQVRQPLNTRGIGRWKNYADVLAPVMTRLEKIVAEDRSAATGIQAARRT